MTDPAQRTQHHLDLADWRRRMAAAYQLGSLEAWRAARGRLFREQPESPIPPADRARFTGLRWFPPAPAYRVPARLGPGDCKARDLDTGGQAGVGRDRRVGAPALRLPGRDC